jgi:hypothetical protein
MRRLIEQFRIFPVQLRDNRTLLLAISQRVEEKLWPPAHIMDMSEFREGNVRLSL